MNPRIALFLCACSTACADLPPVVDKSGGVSPDQAANAARQQSLTTTYDLMKRVEQLQHEVQQLTGKTEEQANQIEELKRQQKTMYTDFDDRINGLEGGKPAGGAMLGSSGGASGPSGTNASPPSSSTPPSDQPTLTLEPMPPPNSSPSGAKAGTPASDSSSSSSGSAYDPALSKAPPDEQADYQKAYNDLRNGRTEQAISGFDDFIIAHPKSVFASNARYWLGEAHRVNLDNNSARRVFSDLVRTYPNSPKTPDALLKLGILEIEDNNNDKAREYLQRVTSEFSGSKAAGIAQKKLLVLDGKSAK